jgi:hypothetical protein
VGASVLETAGRLRDEFERSGSATVQIRVIRVTRIIRIIIRLLGLSLMDAQGPRMIEYKGIICSADVGTTSLG